MQVKAFKVHDHVNKLIIRVLYELDRNWVIKHTTP